jgi:hypothetical protein
MEEMVEAHLKDFRRRRVAGNVTAQVGVGLIGPHHHHKGIPANHAGNALFDRHISWMTNLIAQRNRISICRE